MLIGCFLMIVPIMALALGPVVEHFLMLKGQLF